MSLGKNGIIINIKSKAQISDSKAFLEFFVDLLKKNSKQKIVKISNFGTFYTKNTPQRLGRNPKTKEEFIISKRSKLFFKPSNKIRSVIN
jgi:integration host factor subunit alpha